jgi:hypothetical protein
MKISTVRSMGILFLGLSLSVGIARADLTINNPSFEILPPGGLPFGGCGVGCSYSMDVIPGWVVGNTGDSGQFQPGSSSGNTAYFSSVPDGLTVAYSNGGTITQTLSATVQAGTVYTLTVDIGNRLDCCDGAGAAELLIGNTAFAALGVQPAPGFWSPFSVTYTGTVADAGKPIGIELIADGAQGDFDNVTLSATPEPGFYGLLALGLAGLTYAVIRRRSVGKI